MRMALSRIGLVTVVPGPIGLYRRRILEQIERLPCNRREVESHGDMQGKVYGPLSGETFAEDFQLSLTVLALGYKVVYEPRAFAYTKAPESVEGLMNQRYRWMRGTWQVFMIYLRDLRHVAPLKKKTFPTLNQLMMCLYTIDIYFVPILNFFFWVAIVAAAISGEQMSGIFIWIGAVSLLNLMTAMTYVLMQDEDLRLLPLVFILDVYQSLLVNIAWVIAGIDEARGTQMKWS